MSLVQEPSVKLRSGSQLMIDALLRNGVKHVFGYPGGAIMPLYDALVDSGLKHYLCRHEQGAAFAADAYGRVTRKAGVCMATSGPGATNLVTGIANAYLDSVPMVIITGQVPNALSVGGRTRFLQHLFVGEDLQRWTLFAAAWQPEMYAAQSRALYAGSPFKPGP